MKKEKREKGRRGKRGRREKKRKGSGKEKGTKESQENFIFAISAAVSVDYTTDLPKAGRQLENRQSI